MMCNLPFVGGLGPRLIPRSYTQASTQFLLQMAQALQHEDDDSDEEGEHTLSVVETDR